MIGSYWTTGITVHAACPDDQPVRWSAELSFHDDGFLRDDVAAHKIATQGVLHTRYQVSDTSEQSSLPVILDTLIADAKQLGIEFRRIGGDPPELYINENDLGPYPPLTHLLLTEQAERLGWRGPEIWSYHRPHSSELQAARALSAERLAAMGPDTLHKLYLWHCGLCTACNYDRECPCGWAEPEDVSEHSCSCGFGWGGRLRQLIRDKGGKI